MSIQTLSIQQLTFFHGDKKALNNVSLELIPGKIYGLWGRNGAGKTTLMRCLTGILPAEKGTVTFDGAEPFENREILQKVCFIQENHPLNAQWKVKDVFRLAPNFYPGWDATRAKECLEAFNLKPSTQVKKMSKGMKTALALTIGIASKSPVMIFDEPTNGLDAALREVFYELLLEEVADGERIVIISTHYIQELQRYIEELIVLHEGALIMHETLDEVKNNTGYIQGMKQELAARLDLDHPCILEKTELGPMVRVMVDLKIAAEAGLTVAGAGSRAGTGTTEAEVFATGGGGSYPGLSSSLEIQEHVDLQDYLLRRTDKKGVQE